MNWKQLKNKIDKLSDEQLKGQVMKMNWKQLKNKIDKLSDEQLKGQVCFQDNYDNLMGVNFYLNDDKPPEPMVNEDWDTEVDERSF